MEPSFNKGDLCEIVDLQHKDHYFDRKKYLIGKRVNVIASVSQMFSEENCLFNGWVEVLEDIPELKIKKHGFLSLTHAILKKVE